jgi:hypothetical protein
VGGSALQAEVIRDVATTGTIAIAVGAAATAAAAWGLLERTRALRGTLPLVWQTDKPAYVALDLAEHLAENRVIHFRSRPSTPTDNPASERGIGELKAESGLDAAAPIVDAAALLARLERARWVLDQGRLSATRGWRTAAQLDLCLPRAEDLVHRARIYEEARSAMKEAVLGAGDGRVARKLEREALWRVLERHGLARLHVGGKRLPCPPRARAVDSQTGRMTA